jgi:hypothetical protein
MAAKANINPIQLMDDLFSDWFKKGDWSTAKAFLTALMALDMDADTLAKYQHHTGRRSAPETPFNEAWLIVGRRGGKSLIMALMAVYLACFRDYKQYLVPGEVATIALISKDRKQARTLARYISGFFELPMLSKLLIKETTESFELNNRVNIEIQTANFRSIRGYTIAAALCDEIAFWYNDGSASPDYEILEALRPAMATIPGALLLAASSPYAKRGEMYNAYKRYHEQEGGEVLTWKATTREMNPSVPESVIERAYERDAAWASAEYGAEFRTDLEQFILREVVDLAVRTSPLELPYDKQHRYFAFVDPAGGGADEFTLAIGHREDDVTVIDVLRARRGVPAEITAEYAELLKSYNIRKVTGDKYAGSWPGDEFEKHGIGYSPSEKPKSGLYLDLLPALNSGRVELPPDDRLVNQLLGLERRTARSGKDSIDHAPGGHDDRANVIAGLTSTKAASSYDLETFINGSRADDKPKRTHSQRRPLKEALRAAGIPLN